MRGFTDMHHHIINGVDDGARSFDHSACMLALAYRDRVRDIVATPHISPGLKRFDLPLFLDRVEDLNSYAKSSHLDVIVHPGSEVFFTDATMRLLDAGKVPTLAGTTCVLVEFSPDIAYGDIYQHIRALGNRGYTPILAHVERYRCFYKQIDDLYELKNRLGAQLQMNCNTVIHPPFALRRFVRVLIGEGLVDIVATDAHNTGTRKSRMLDAYETIVRHHDTQTARKLTIYNPNKLLFMSPPARVLLP